MTFVPFGVFLGGLALSACAFGTESQPNLLQNPGFEQRDKSGKASPWVFTKKGGLVSAPDHAVHAGRFAARVRFEDRASQKIGSRPDEWFAVTGFCCAESPGTKEAPRIKLYFIDGDGHTIATGGGTIGGLSAQGGFASFEIPFRTPPGTASVSVNLVGAFGGSDWFLFDDLSVRNLPVKDRPAAADVPDLQGKTVMVADRADARSFALYRLPAVAQLPIDGNLSTAAWTGRSEQIRRRPSICDIDVRLGKPFPVSWVLIHALNPLRRLGAAELQIGDQRLSLEDSTEFVHSLRWPRTETRSLRLRVLGTGQRTAEINEIQLFDIREGVDTASGIAVPFAFAQGTSAEANQTLRLLVRPPVQHARVGVRALALHLALLPAGRDGQLDIALKECEELDLNVEWAELTDRGHALAASEPPRCHADVFRLSTNRPGKQQSPFLFAFDIPDTVPGAGEALAIELRSDLPLSLDPDKSFARLVTCAPTEAYPEYVPRLERVMRRLYSQETEAHAYDGSAGYAKSVLYRYVQRVLEQDPRNQPAIATLCRIAHRLPLVEVSRPGPDSAPDWAVWGRHAQREWHGILRWWLDNRWVESGEIGGELNDDVEYSCHWPLSYLITGDDSIRRAQRAIADAVWEQSGQSGYSIRATDVEHAGEDSGCSLPQMLVCEYGSPVHVERMMKMSRLIPFWTGVDAQGRRRFRSYVFNATYVEQGKEKDIDHLYCALAMIGPAHLSWYNRHPLTTQWITEYARTWAEAGMSTAKGKPAGALPCDIRFSTGEIAPYTDRWDRSVYYSFGSYVMESFLAGALRLGVNAGPDLARFTDITKDKPQDVVRTMDKALQRFESPPPPLSPGKPFAADRTWNMDLPELPAYLATLTTGDKRYVAGCLRELAREFERTRYLLTAAEPYTDRIPVPGTRLLRHMFLGGDVAGKTHVPGLAVSWDGGGTDFAALVLQSTNRELKALIYSFAGQPLEMGMRVWRLDPGRYELLNGPDGNGDDQIDSEPGKRLLTLQRHSRIPLTVPPLQTLVVQLRQIEPATPVSAQPDLAVSPEDLAIQQNALSLTVHNIGIAAAPSSRLRMLNATGKSLAEVAVPPLPAPLDLLPQTITLHLPLKNGATRVTLETPDDQEPENNTVELPSRR